MTDILTTAVGETIYMSFVSTFFAVIIGFFLAIILTYFAFVGLFKLKLKSLTTFSVSFSMAPILP